MNIGIVVAMRTLAQVKNPGKEIEPLPGQTWRESYHHYKDVKQHYLGYHIKGEKSSAAIALQY